MRVLVVRLTDKAELTFLALDENGESLENNTFGKSGSLEEIVLGINQIVHRYCIDVIMPVTNGWGAALLQELLGGKYCDRVARNVKTDTYGWDLNWGFLDVIPKSDSASQYNENVLAAIAHAVRNEHIQIEVEKMQGLLSKEAL